MTREEQLGPIDWLFAIAEKLPGVQAKVQRLTWSYFLGPPADSVEETDEEYTKWAGFLKWALLVPHGGDEKTLAEQAVERERDLSPGERTMLMEAATVQYVYGRIRSFREDGCVEVTDMLTGDRMVAAHPLEAADLQLGNGLIGPVHRLASPDEPDPVIAFDPTVTVVATIAPFEDADVYAHDTEMVGLLLGQGLAGVDTEWIRRLDLHQWRVAYESFAKVLKPFGQISGPGRLQKRVVAAASLENLWEQETIDWWTGAEIEVFDAFAHRLRELTPRRQ